MSDHRTVDCDLRISDPFFRCTRGLIGDRYKKYKCYKEVLEDARNEMHAGLGPFHVSQRWGKDVSGQEIGLRHPVKYTDTELYIYCE